MFGCAVLLAAPSAWAQRGDPTSCDFNLVDMFEVRYYHATFQEQDYKCDADDPAPCDVSLRGWLYMADDVDVSNAKAIIYNHGHDKERGEPCAVVEEFVGKGYVVFAPLRRGHEAKDGSIRSTGVHIDDFVEAQCGSACDVLNCTGVFCDAEEELQGAYQVDYLDNQVFEIREQIEWLAKRRNQLASGGLGSGKLVDPDKIALMGQSFGGSLVIIANAADPEVGSTANPPVRFQSVVTISPAELQWQSSTAWKTALTAAIQNAHEPLYILQPKNAKTLEPSRVLGAASIGANHRGQVGIFPNAAATDADGDGVVGPGDIHSNFMSAASINDWGPSVHQFMLLYFRR
jgi:dienelactone hydrolase